MIENCIYETWNYKYNQFTPVEIKEKVDQKFVKIHGYAKVRDEKTGEMKIEEYDTMTYLEGMKNIGSWEFDILKLFPENSMLQTRGYRVIVDKAVFDEEENIRIYYKYLECDEDLEREIKSKSSAWSFIAHPRHGILDGEPWDWKLYEFFYNQPEKGSSCKKSEPWSWINSYGAQWKKINAGYNFITLRPDDKIEFRSFTPSRLMEERIRKDWYFSDPIDKEVVIGMEKILGYIRDDGKTWMEYFWGATKGKQYGVKVKDDGSLILIDSTDPKNPIQAVKESEIEKFIEGVKEYAEK